MHSSAALTLTSFPRAEESDKATFVFLGDLTAEKLSTGQSNKTVGLSDV